MDERKRILHPVFFIPLFSSPSLQPNVFHSLAHKEFLKRGMPMSEWIKVAMVDEIEPGKKKAVSAGGTSIVLVQVDGNVYAVENVCSHQGAPLVTGILKGNLLMCTTHGWKFDVCTGHVVRGNDDIKAFPVKVEDGAVFVEV